MKIVSFVLTAAFTCLSLTGCENSSPPPETVSYARDVAPILQTHCLKCHNLEGDGYKVSGLNMESYGTLMDGTKFGPVIVPGNSISSTLVRVINGKADPAITMPHGGLQLIKEQEVKKIAHWIDQGAKDN
ncbi:c-type cytochrome domain-containing protein [Kaarinaea lacus]